MLQKSESDGGNQNTCKPMRNDYLECLHHKKELARVEAIATEAERQANPKAHGGGHQLCVRGMAI